MWDYFNDIQCITIPDSNQIKGFEENIKYYENIN